MSDDDEVNITRIEMGTGWVCFTAGDKPPPSEQLPGLLNKSMCTWLQRNAAFTVRATLPIVQTGNTIAIHVWFD